MTGGFFNSLLGSKTTLQKPTIPSFKVGVPSFKIGGPVAEDRRMTFQAFNVLIEEMVPIQGDLCPQHGKMATPFNDKIMPDLSCPGSKFGGRRRTRKFKNKKRNTRQKKRLNISRRH
jgi:hypothetical protein